MPAMPFDNQLTASQSEADFIYTSFQGHRRQFCPAFSAASGLWLQGMSVHPCLTGPKVEGASLSSPIGLRFFFVGSNWKRRIQSHPPPQKTTNFQTPKFSSDFHERGFFSENNSGWFVEVFFFFRGLKARLFQGSFKRKHRRIPLGLRVARWKVTGFFFCVSL